MDFGSGAGVLSDMYLCIERFFKCCMFRQLQFFYCLNVIIILDPMLSRSSISVQPVCFCFFSQRKKKIDKTFAIFRRVFIVAACQGQLASVQTWNRLFNGEFRKRPEQHEWCYGQSRAAGSHSFLHKISVHRPAENIPFLDNLDFANN